MEAIVYIVFSILQIFFATRAVLKIGEHPRIFPSFSWEIFAHVTRLDQSRKYLMNYNCQMERELRSQSEDSIRERTLVDIY